MWVVALIVSVQVKVVLAVVVVVVEEEVGEAEGRDSYCEIPVEGNWNSIGVRSWLLPSLL